MIQNKQIIGLTGGSGCGKSMAAHIFAQLGIYVIDADKTARLVMEPGEECLCETVKAFGAEILLPDGHLNRCALGDLVFRDPEKLAHLNRITHKYITERMEEEIFSCSASYVLLDGAVLIESGISKRCDVLISVLADREIRIERIMERDHIDRKRAEERINAQKNDAFYIENSQYLLYNNTTEENLRQQVREVWEKLKDSGSIQKNSGRSRKSEILS